MTVAVIVGVVVAYRRRQEIRDWLDAHRRHPLVRPLFVVARPLYRWVIHPVARFVAPYLRFLWDRVTPGEVGLELTTLLAAAGVGAFVFVTYLTQLSADPGPTPLDSDLLDLADRLRTTCSWTWRRSSRPSAPFRPSPVSSSPRRCC